MLLISITGTTSGVGKTTIIEQLLPNLTGSWGVCKVTVCVEGHHCPRGKDDTCGVCSTLDDAYCIESSDEVIGTPGKDTWRYIQAGAAKVRWVKTRPEHLSESVESVFSAFQNCTGIIFEGNSALTVLQPDLAVMVRGNPVKYKRSAKKVLERIDMFGEASDPRFQKKILDFILEKR